MKKKIKDLTIEELNKFCHKHYYSNEEGGSCKNCPLCWRFYKDTEIGYCLVNDNLGTMDEKDLEKEVEVDE